MFIHILFSIIFLFINSLDGPNVSRVDNFIELLNNFTLNFSSFAKISPYINTTQYCLIHDDILPICLQCKENYTLINGECVCYDRNCKTCTSSLYGSCIECHQGYALSTDNTCRCKIEHCLLCDDHICNVCEKGYILTEYNTTCEFIFEYQN